MVWGIIVGSLGFLCYFIYDINSITVKNPVMQKLFAVGTLLVAGATVGLLVRSREEILAAPLRAALCGILAAVMLGLLIYTLFFAVPFKATYMEENREREAFTEGMYALCRHPGVLWFTLFYISLAGMAWTLEAFVEVALLILWDVAYICVQDWKIFPLTFTNYESYRQTTPFLFPNRKSIRRCFRTARKGGAAL